MDEDGYYFITDRLKRMINASGFKVWPAEVELLMFRHPAIQEACVIGTKDAYRGESVKAVVVLRPTHRDTTEQQMRVILSAQSARLVDGPTAAGAYVVRVDDGDPAVAIKALRESSQVVLAEPLANDGRP